MLRSAVFDLYCLFFISFACQTACGCFFCVSRSESCKISSTMRNSRDKAPKMDSFLRIFLMSSELTCASGLTSFKRWSLIGFDVSSCVESTSHVLCFFAAYSELFFLRFFLRLSLVNTLVKVQSSGTLLSFSTFCALLCAVFGASGAMLLGFNISSWFTNTWLDPLLALISQRA